LINAFNGPFGKIVAGLIAEGPREPRILQQFFERWLVLGERRPSPNCSEARMQASCGRRQNLNY
jgi:hypothetical protein